MRHGGKASSIAITLTAAAARVHAVTNPMHDATAAAVVVENATVAAIYRIPPIGGVPRQAGAVVVRVVQVHPPAGGAARQAAVHAHPAGRPPAPAVLVVGGPRAVRVRGPKPVLFPTLGGVVVASGGGREEKRKGYGWCIVKEL